MSVEGGPLPVAQVLAAAVLRAPRSGSSARADVVTAASAALLHDIHASGNPSDPPAFLQFDSATAAINVPALPLFPEPRRAGRAPATRGWAFATWVRLQQQGAAGSGSDFERGASRPPSCLLFRFTSLAGCAVEAWLTPVGGTSAAVSVLHKLHLKVTTARGGLKKPVSQECTVRLLPGLWHHVAVSVAGEPSKGSKTPDAAVYIDGEVAAVFQLPALHLPFTRACFGPGLLGALAHTQLLGDSLSASQVGVLFGRGPSLSTLHHAPPTVEPARYTAAALRTGYIGASLERHAHLLSAAGEGAGLEDPAVAAAAAAAVAASKPSPAAAKASTVGAGSGLGAVFSTGIGAGRPGGGSGSGRSGGSGADSQPAYLDPATRPVAASLPPVIMLLDTTCIGRIVTFEKPPAHQGVGAAAAAAASASTSLALEASSRGPETELPSLSSKGWVRTAGLGIVATLETEASAPATASAAEAASTPASLPATSSSAAAGPAGVSASHTPAPHATDSATVCAIWWSKGTTVRGAGAAHTTVHGHHSSGAGGSSGLGGVTRALLPPTSAGAKVGDTPLPSSVPALPGHASMTGRRGDTLQPLPVPSGDAVVLAPLPRMPAGSALVPALEAAGGGSSLRTHFGFFRSESSAAIAVAGAAAGSSTASGSSGSSSGGGGFFSSSSSSSSSSVALRYTAVVGPSMLEPFYAVLGKGIRVTTPAAEAAAAAGLRPRRSLMPPLGAWAAAGGLRRLLQALASVPVGPLPLPWMQQSEGSTSAGFASWASASSSCAPFQSKRVAEAFAAVQRGLLDCIGGLDAALLRSHPVFAPLLPGLSEGVQPDAAHEGAAPASPLPSRHRLTWSDPVATWLLVLSALLDHHFLHAEEMFVMRGFSLLKHLLHKRRDAAAAALRGLPRPKLLEATLGTAAALAPWLARGSGIIAARLTKGWGASAAQHSASNPFSPTTPLEELLPAVVSEDILRPPSPARRRSLVSSSSATAGEGRNSRRGSTGSTSGASEAAASTVGSSGSNGSGPAPRAPPASPAEAAQLAYLLGRASWGVRHCLTDAVWRACETLLVSTRRWGKDTGVLFAAALHSLVADAGIWTNAIRLDPRAPASATQWFSAPVPPLTALPSEHLHAFTARYGAVAPPDPAALLGPARLLSSLARRHPVLWKRATGLTVPLACDALVAGVKAFAAMAVLEQARTQIRASHRWIHDVHLHALQGTGSSQPASPYPAPYDAMEPALLVADTQAAADAAKTWAAAVAAGVAEPVLEPNPARSLEAILRAAAEFVHCWVKMLRVLMCMSLQAPLPVEAPPEGPGAGAADLNPAASRRLTYEALGDLTPAALSQTAALTSPVSRAGGGVGSASGIPSGAASANGSGAPTGAAGSGARGGRGGRAMPASAQVDADVRALLACACVLVEEHCSFQAQQEALMLQLQHLHANSRCGGTLGGITAEPFLFVPCGPRARDPFATAAGSTINLLNLLVRSYPPKMHRALETGNGTMAITACTAADCEAVRVAAVNVLAAVTALRRNISPDLYGGKGGRSGVAGGPGGSGAGSAASAASALNTSMAGTEFASEVNKGGRDGGAQAGSSSAAAGSSSSSSSSSSSTTGASWNDVIASKPFKHTEETEAAAKDKRLMLLRVLLNSLSDRPNTTALSALAALQLAFAPAITGEGPTGTHVPTSAEAAASAAASTSGAVAAGSSGTSGGRGRGSTASNIFEDLLGLGGSSTASAASGHGSAAAAGGSASSGAGGPIKAVPVYLLDDPLISLADDPDALDITSQLSSATLTTSGSAPELLCPEALPLVFSLLQQAERTQVRAANALGAGLPMPPPAAAVHITAPPGTPPRFRRPASLLMETAQLAYTRGGCSNASKDATGAAGIVALEHETQLRMRVMLDASLLVRGRGKTMDAWIKQAGWQGWLLDLIALPTDLYEVDAATAVTLDAKEVLPPSYLAAVASPLAMPGAAYRVPASAATGSTAPAPSSSSTALCHTPGKVLLLPPTAVEAGALFPVDPLAVSVGAGSSGHGTSGATSARGSPPPRSRAASTFVLKSVAEQAAETITATAHSISALAADVLAAILVSALDLPDGWKAWLSTLPAIRDWYARRAAGSGCDGSDPEAAARLSYQAACGVSAVVTLALQRVVRERQAKPSPHLRTNLLRTLRYTCCRLSGLPLARMALASLPLLWWLRTGSFSGCPGIGSAAAAVAAAAAGQEGLGASGSAGGSSSASGAAAALANTGSGPAGPTSVAAPALTTTSSSAATPLRGQEIWVLLDLLVRSIPTLCGVVPVGLQGVTAHIVAPHPDGLATVLAFLHAMQLDEIHTLPDAGKDVQSGIVVDTAAVTSGGTSPHASAASPSGAGSSAMAATASASSTAAGAAPPVRFSSRDLGGAFKMAFGRMSASLQGPGQPGSEGTAGSHASTGSHGVFASGTSSSSSLTASTGSAGAPVNADDASLAMLPGLGMRPGTDGRVEAVVFIISGFQQGIDAARAVLLALGKVATEPEVTDGEASPASLAAARELQGARARDCLNVLVVTTLTTLNESEWGVWGRNVGDLRDTAYVAGRGRVVPSLPLLECMPQPLPVALEDVAAVDSAANSIEEGADQATALVPSAATDKVPSSFDRAQALFTSLEPAIADIRRKVEGVLGGTVLAFAGLLIPVRSSSTDSLSTGGLASLSSTALLPAPPAPAPAPGASGSGSGITSRLRSSSFSFGLALGFGFHSSSSEDLLVLDDEGAATDSKNASNAALAAAAAAATQASLGAAGSTSVGLATGVSTASFSTAAATTSTGTSSSTSSIAALSGLAYTWVSTAHGSVWVDPRLDWVRSLFVAEVAVRPPHPTTTFVDDSPLAKFRGDRLEELEARVRRYATRAAVASRNIATYWASLTRDFERCEAVLAAGASPDAAPEAGVGIKIDGHETGGRARLRAVPTSDPPLVALPYVEAGRAGGAPLTSTSLDDTVLSVSLDGSFMSEAGTATAGVVGGDAAAATFTAEVPVGAAAEGATLASTTDVTAAPPSSAIVSSISVSLRSLPLLSIPAATTPASIASTPLPSASMTTDSGLSTPIRAGALILPPSSSVSARGDEGSGVIRQLAKRGVLRRGDSSAMLLPTPSAGTTSGGAGATGGLAASSRRFSIVDEASEQQESEAGEEATSAPSSPAAPSPPPTTSRLASGSDEDDVTGPAVSASESEVDDDALSVIHHEDEIDIEGVIETNDVQASEGINDPDDVAGDEEGATEEGEEEGAGAAGEDRPGSPHSVHDPLAEDTPAHASGAGGEAPGAGGGESSRSGSSSATDVNSAAAVALPPPAPLHVDPATVARAAAATLVKPGGYALGTVYVLSFGEVVWMPCTSEEEAARVAAPASQTPPPDAEAVAPPRRPRRWLTAHITAVYIRCFRLQDCAVEVFVSPGGTHRRRSYFLSFDGGAKERDEVCRAMLRLAPRTALDALLERALPTGSGPVAAHTLLSTLFSSGLPGVGLGVGATSATAGGGPASGSLAPHIYGDMGGGDAMAMRYSQIPLLMPSGSSRSLATRAFAGTVELHTRRVHREVLAAWRARRLSNFDYLMVLNTLAGRSFCDYSQYPVFPWVLGDYASAGLDLTSPAAYRDLARPMGALTAERLREFRARYDSFEDDDIPKFLYGSHYSTGLGTVAHYLLRLAPWTRIHVALQGGHFDVADRLFASVADAWKTNTTMLSEVKELIPEFYSTPAFLVNAGRHRFGSLQDGTPVDHVALPAWAGGDPARFIRTMRAALESEYASLHLHAWIDLVFGCKQQGPAAEAADNVFFHLTYAGAVDLDEIEDADLRRATQLQIAQFGQTPLQVFRDPHPARGPHPAPPAPGVPRTGASAAAALIAAADHRHHIERAKRQTSGSSSSRRGSSDEAGTAAGAESAAGVTGLPMSPSALAATAVGGLKRAASAAASTVLATGASIAAALTGSGGASAASAGLSRPLAEELRDYSHTMETPEGSAGEQGGAQGFSLVPTRAFSFLCTAPASGASFWRPDTPHPLPLALRDAGATPRGEDGATSSSSSNNTAAPFVYASLGDCMTLGSASPAATLLVRLPSAEVSSLVFDARCPEGGVSIAPQPETGSAGAATQAAWGWPLSGTGEDAPEADGPALSSAPASPLLPLPSQPFAVPLRFQFVCELSGYGVAAATAAGAPTLGKSSAATSSSDTPAVPSSRTLGVPFPSPVPQPKAAFHVWWPIAPRGYVPLGAVITPAVFDASVSTTSWLGMIGAALGGGTPGHPLPPSLLSCLCVRTTLVQRSPALKTVVPLPGFALGSPASAAAAAAAAAETAATAARSTQVAAALAEAAGSDSVRAPVPGSGSKDEPHSASEDEGFGDDLPASVDLNAFVSAASSSSSVVSEVEGMTAEERSSSTADEVDEALDSLNVSAITATLPPLNTSTAAAAAIAAARTSWYEHGPWIEEVTAVAAAEEAPVSASSLPGAPGAALPSLGSFLASPGPQVPAPSDALSAYMASPTATPSTVRTNSSLRLYGRTSRPGAAIYEADNRLHSCIVPCPLSLQALPETAPAAASDNCSLASAEQLALVPTTVPPHPETAPALFRAAHALSRGVAFEFSPATLAAHLAVPPAVPPALPLPPTSTPAPPLSESAFMDQHFTADWVPSVAASSPAALYAPLADGGDSGPTHAAAVSSLWRPGTPLSASIVGLRITSPTRVPVYSAGGFGAALASAAASSSTAAAPAPTGTLLSCPHHTVIAVDAAGRIDRLRVTSIPAHHWGTVASDLQHTAALMLGLSPDPSARPAPATFIPPVRIRLTRDGTVPLGPLAGGAGAHSGAGADRRDRAASAGASHGLLGGSHSNASHEASAPDIPKVPLVGVRAGAGTAPLLPLALGDTASGCVVISGCGPGRGIEVSAVDVRGYALAGAGGAHGSSGSASGAAGGAGGGGAAATGGASAAVAAAAAGAGGSAAGAFLLAATPAGPSGSYAGGSSSGSAGPGILSAHSPLVPFADANGYVGAQWCASDGVSAGSDGPGAGLPVPLMGSSGSLTTAAKRGWGSSSSAALPTAALAAGASSSATGGPVGDGTDGVPWAGAASLSNCRIAGSLALPSPSPYDAASAVALSSDVLAVGHAEGTVSLWRAGGLGSAASLLLTWPSLSPRPHAVIRPPLGAGAVTHLALSHEGDSLAVAYAGGAAGAAEVWVYCLSTAAPLQRLTPPPAAAAALAEAAAAAGGAALALTCAGLCTAGDGSTLAVAWGLHSSSAQALQHWSGARAWVALYDASVTATPGRPEQASLGLLPFPHVPTCFVGLRSGAAPRDYAPSGTLLALGWAGGLTLLDSAAFASPSSPTSSSKQRSTGALAPLLSWRSPYALPVRCVDLAPCGSYLVAGCDDGVIAAFALPGLPVTLPSECVPPPEFGGPSRPGTVSSLLEDVGTGLVNLASSTAAMAAEAAKAAGGRASATAADPAASSSSGAAAAAGAETKGLKSLFGSLFGGSNAKK